MPGKALDGLKVVELGDFVPAPYCTKLMADLGADVIKIEPPGTGDSARRYGPFPGDEPHPEKSLLFAYMNTNKRGITLDVTSPLGRRLFTELLKDTDVLVESNSPAKNEALGLEYESLAAVNPRLIVTSITPFGQTGPYRNYKSTELVAFQIGGIGYPTPGDVEEPETHPPLKAPGHQAHLMAGITGAAGAMSAVLAREFTGRGQQVDVSEQDTLLRAIGMAVFSELSRGETPIRIAGMGRPIAARKPMLAKDGYFTAQLFMDHFWESMKSVMGHPEWMDSELFADRDLRMENMDAALLLIEDWSKDYTKEELFQLLQVENHIPCLPVNTLEEIFAHPHYQARGTFIEMEHPQIGRFKAAAPPYLFSETPWRMDRPAPALGQHNEEVIIGGLGYSKGDLVRMKQMGVI